MNLSFDLMEASDIFEADADIFGDLKFFRLDWILHSETPSTWIFPPWGVDDSDDDDEGDGVKK